MMGMARSKTIARIHLWIGLPLAIYGVLVGLSGAILVFDDEIIAREISTFGHASSGATGVADPERVLEGIRAHYRGWRALSLTWPNQESPYWMVYILRESEALEVYFHPEDGTIAGTRDPRTGFMGWLKRLHTNLLNGRVGRLLNGYAACGLVVSAVTGIVLWWPRKIWMLSLRGRDLHFTAGISAALFLVVISVTGTYFIWPAAYVHTVSRILPRTSEPKLTAGTKAPVLGLNELARIAAKTIPGVPIHRLQIVDRPDLAVRVTYREASPGEFHLVSTAFLNPVTGEVLNLVRLQNRPSGDGLLAWFSALHFGIFGGLAGKLVWCLLGLSLPLLGATGTWMWWRRVVRPALIKHAPSPIGVMEMK